MRLILASQSPRRQKILRDAGYVFEIMPADIDEKAIRSDDFEQLPLLIARAKAEHVARNMNDAIVIAADQVIVWNGELREKPRSKEQEYEWLIHYSLYPAQIINGLFVLNTLSKVSAEAVETSQCVFKNIPHDTALALAERGEMLDCAGGFMVEHPDLKPFVSLIEGPVDSFGGLPLLTLEKLLTEVGYH